MAQNLLGFALSRKQKPNQVRLLCMILNHEENPFTLKTFVHLRDKPSEMMLNFNPQWLRLLNNPTEPNELHKLELPRLRAAMVSS